MADRYGLGEPVYDPAEAKVDIVFVHGLGGDRVKTWTWEGKDRVAFWPHDFLPQSCPTARILSFGYDAAFAHFYPFYGPKFVSEQLTIDDHSTALLQSLVGLRGKTDSSDRPLIFVTHSLGGLVCANALSRQHGTDVASIHLVEKTIGVIFLGTPFEGSSKVKWASRALKMLDWISTTHQEDIKDLEERSAKLMHIHDAFHKFLKVRDRSETRQFVEVACFFEQYATYKAGKKVGTIVPMESASLSGIKRQPIQANHSDMCKFEDEDREGYKGISELISQWITDLENAKSSIAENQKHSVYMGDVNFREKISNNHGIVMGHAYSPATHGIQITGSTTSNTYHAVRPGNFGPNACQEKGQSSSAGD